MSSKKGVLRPSFRDCPDQFNMTNCNGYSRKDVGRCSSHTCDNSKSLYIVSKTRSILTKIVVALSITILGSSVLVSVLAHNAEHEQEFAFEADQVLTQQKLLAKDVVVSFKKQVQEWKNILLRGHDKNDLERYKSQFSQMEAHVSSGLVALSDTQLGDRSRQLLKEVQADLASLNGDYHEALKLYERGEKNAYQLADRRVRGGDRAPTNKLEELLVLIDTDRPEAIEAERLRIESRHQWFNIAAIVVFTLAIFATLAYLYRLFVVPVLSLIRCTSELSDGDNKIVVPYTSRRDEIGQLASAIESLRRGRVTSMALQRSAQLAFEVEESERRKALEEELENQKQSTESIVSEHDQKMLNASKERERELSLRLERLSKAVSSAAKGDLKYLAKHRDSQNQHDDSLSRMTSDLETLFGQFDTDFHHISDDAVALDDAADTLTSLSDCIGTGAQLNTDQSSRVLSKAQQVRESIVKMSEDITAMATGIGQIQDSAAEASSVAEEAVELGQNTDATMRKLSTSSVDIGNVIKLINSIAEQTNLLALNATIEAARAGDAGKGFAVVANEVKELAKETNKATEEIQSRIDAIRGETDQAVDAIGNINRIVSQINEIQVGITESVQGQSKSAEIILELVDKTLGGNQEVRSLIVDVNERQSETLESTVKIREASTRLKHSASNSLSLTGRYVRSV